MALSGKVAAVYKESGPSTAFTDAATTSSAGYTRYTITDAAKRYIDRNVAVTVKKNGVIQTTGFTIEYPGGVVVFSTPLLATDVVLVSGNAFPMAQIGGMFNWKADLDQDLQDVTTFDSGGWKQQLAVLRGFSGSAEAFWGDGSLFAELTSAEGAEMVVALYVDNGASKRRYEGYARLTKDSIEVPVDGIIKESIDFQGDGPLYYREG